jgi:hypothetical protein
MIHPKLNKPHVAALPAVRVLFGAEERGNDPKLKRPNATTSLP